MWKFERILRFRLIYLREFASVCGKVGSKHLSICDKVYGFYFKERIYIDKTDSNNGTSGSFNKQNRFISFQIPT
jgi:hypothetical protein